MHTLKPESEPIVLEVARKELGVREGRDDKRIVAYHQATRLRAQNSKTAWCASFVCWVLEQSGLPNPRTARAADFIKYGRETFLEPGAIVVFAPPPKGKPNADNASSGHVGFLVGVEGENLIVLSGNSANCVRISPYPVSRLVATRWPVV